MVLVAAVLLWPATVGPAMAPINPAAATSLLVHVRMFFHLSWARPRDLALSVGRRLPEQHHRVGAPWTPGFRLPLELDGGTVADHPPQDEIAARKRIRLSEGAHGDVLRRPVTDAGNGHECGHGRRAIRGGGKRDGSAQSVPGESTNG